MKLHELWEKVKELAGKTGVRMIAAAAVILVIGAVVVINFILPNVLEEPDTGRLAVDLSTDPTSDPVTASEPVSDYFAEVSLERKQARDEAMEVLLSVSESGTALEEARQAALDDMNRMALTIEQEANIETLVESKGFRQCVAVINDDKCNVIVESAGLMPGEVAQISEIVYEQAGIVPDHLKIIEKNTDM